MKFVCIGFFKEKKLESLSDSEQEQLIREYAGFFEQIKKNQKLLSGTGLKSAAEGCSLWKENDTVRTSSLEIEEDQIGGIFILEAQDLEEAVSIVEKHPGLKIGWFQIRPIDEELTKSVGVNQETS